MKAEASGVAIEEFVGLKTKMYCFWYITTASTKK